MLPSGLDFIETFLGIAYAGMIAVPVYPPARLTRLDHYLRTLGSIADTSSCRVAVLDERLVPLVGKHVSFAGQAILTDKELRAAREPGKVFPLESSSPAFLQFTSGTTSQPRGVLLRHDQVQAQLAAYNEALDVQTTDTIVSWLPLYHDLGLVGMVLASLHAGAHLVLLSPVDFLKEPMSWLRALSRYRAIHTAAPNFAYQLCVRKCPADRLRAEKIDLSSVENSGMGGEPVAWTTIESFRAHFAPFGFKAEALNPCYGLAENTLVVSGHRRGEALRSLVVSQGGLQANEVREPTGDADRATLVGNGRPFPGMTVRIEGPAGEVLGEKKIGEVRVRSPSLASGYFGDREATDAVFREREGERWLATGDLGFLADGDVYICGRKKDLLIVRGRNFHPQDLELEAGSVKGVRTGNVVAFSIDRGDGQGEVAVLVAEVDPGMGRSVDEIRRDVAEAISGAFQLALSEVLLLPKGSIPKTSSGKLQRGLVKEAYRKGELASFAPPGWLGSNLAKLGLAWDALGHRLRKKAPSASKELALESATKLDPRFAEAVRRVKPDHSFHLAPELRLDGLGLDSLERVELFLQLGRSFQAEVPEAELSASRTVGEVQAILERHEGTAPAEARTGASLLVEDLLAESAPPRPAFQPPFTAPFAFSVLAATTRVCWGLETKGLEHLEREGGYILAGNHESYLDPAWLRQVLPASVRERLVAYNWAGAPRFTRPFLAQMDTIPIDEADFVRSIRAGLGELRAGKVLLIFPEGTRTRAGSMAPFRPGVGFLSLLAQRPIVPFRLRGMFEVYPRHKALPRFWPRRGKPPMEIQVGPALAPPALDAERAWSQAREVVRGLRAAVEGL